MKKLLTLILAICMIAACALPVGAASYEFDTIRGAYELGKPIINYIFEKSEDANDFDKDKGKSMVVSDGCLVSVGDELTDATNTIDINMPAETKVSEKGYVLFSFEFNIDNKDSVVKFRLGPDDKNGNQYMQMDFYKGSFDAYKTTTLKENFDYSQSEMTKVDILADLNNNCYYAWVNVEDDKLFVTEPQVNGFPFTKPCTAGYVKVLRMWTGTLTETTTIKFDNYSVTPLKERVLIPRYTEYYCENFDSYTAGSSDFITTVGDILTIPSGLSGNPVQCKTEELSIVNEADGDNRLNVTYTEGSNYHNWYYTAEKSNPEGAFVVQVDVKGYGGEAHVRLGSYNDSKVPVAIKGYKDKTIKYLAATEETELKDAPPFMYNNQADCESADYTTLTFLVNGDKYSLWMNDACVLENVQKRNTSAINSICFYVKKSDVVMYVDNIRVYDGNAFLKVYNLVNSNETDITDCVNLGDDGKLSSFKTADEIFGANSELVASYSEDAGYYNDYDIAFPLFSNAANTRVIFTEGDNILSSVNGALTFPSGYTEITRLAGAGAKKASFAVNLRNDASARTDELLVMAAAYDSSGKIIKIKGCTFENDAFVADFGDGVEYASAEAFVWEKTTLRPVQ